MKTKFSLIFLFFILNIIVSAQDIKIISSDASSIIIEYIPGYSDTSIINSNGNKYFKVSLPLSKVFNIENKGEAQIPVREIYVGVPSETGNTLQVISQDYTYLNGKYVPMPKLVKDATANTEEYFESEQYSQSRYRDVANFGQFGLTRNLRVQTIDIFPVQYDGAENKIKLLKKLVFKINYAPVNSSNLQKINNDFFQALVVNWQFAKNWGVKETSFKKVTGSVLASGDWYKFETTEEGIYKIDKAYLQKLGVDVSTIDPRTIKIYGNGGYSLPINLAATNNQGLIENSIMVNGESDGNFDDGDYILFYGRSTDFWEYSAAISSIIRKKQPFSKKNYYWLTYNGVNGKRMSQKQSTNVQNAYQQQLTQAFLSYDKDSVNIGKSGQDYLCDPMESSGSIKSRIYYNSLNGILPGSTIKYNFRVVNPHESSATTPAISYRVEENGNVISTGNISGIVSLEYLYGRESKKSVSIINNLTDEKSILKFTLATSAAGAKMYLDYFEISYQKYLKAFGDNLLFFSKDTNAVINYTLTNFTNSSMQTFDITDFSNVRIISGASVNGGDFTFQASETAGSVSKYIAVTPSQYKTPGDGVKVENIDLRGNLSGSEMIVITSKEFKTQAERYAQYRSAQSPNKLTTSIYYVDDIINDFGAGLLDPTAIRDFLKFSFDNWHIKPMYVLLFGDASYDYLNTSANNKNFVPVYQVPNSLSELAAYPMDDFYSRISGNDSSADIGVGRLCVNTTEEADNIITKIIDYENNLDKGNWRDRITLVADDGLAGTGDDDGDLHTNQSEILANTIIPPYMDLDKIYLVAYPTSYVGTGRRKPEVNKAIINSINNSTLILNYVGHGAPLFWAHEDVFEIASAVPQMNNKNYFFLTAATCDFGLYDNPSSTSGAEALVFSLTNSGAIIALTAARVVESTSNSILNQVFYSNLFNVHNIGGSYDRVGTAYMLTKQSRTGPNDEKFHFFGDPAIKLNLPQLEVDIDSINRKPTTTASQIQISALSNVKVHGKIKNDDGSVNPVNGEVIVSVFDSERKQKFEEIENYEVTLQGGLIFRGRTSVTNGEFTTEFVVPKDISYENKEGKIVAYFFNENTDGVGTTSNFTVGGTDTSVVNDNKGPEIEIFFDNENFMNSYLVNPNFTLIAKLNDQTGLNTTGTGIGHKLEGILNDDLTNTIDLTNYFVGDVNSGGKSGQIQYKVSSMEPGDYKIKVKAWDVFNNYSYQETYFTVVEADQGIVVRDVYNFPNPFSSNTTFTFQHNVVGSINVKVKVYTIAGRLIKEIEQNELLEKFVRIDWDGRDEDGNSLANGTYLYKLIVESADGQYKENVLGKLAVIR